MSVYELQIQTDVQLISESIECDNNEGLGKYVKRALTEGLSLMEADGKSGRFIPAHEIKKIKWRKANGST